MDKIEIKKLIEEALKHITETENIELKDARGGFPRSTWKTVSSFSHRPGGGIIAFGVSEDKEQGRIEVLGVDNIALLQEKVSDLVSNEMSFTIRPDYHILEIGGKPLLYDSTQAEGTTLDDLSKEKILGLLARSGERTGRGTGKEDVGFELLKNLGIADNYNGIEAPTIAGFLIFSRIRPQDKQYFNRYIVRCVRYKGSNVATDIIDNIDVDGTLDVQIDSIQKFILRNIKKTAEIIGTKREERYEYSEKAIREIVANAVIHRDYKITETYSQINIFEDRIEVFNPGCLPPGVTVENIKDAQVSRNEIIAARLKELDYLEEYGRGIDIVFSKMKEWSLLPPIFKNTANSFKVILMGERLSKLNERQVKIWEHLVGAKRITAKECKELLHKVPRQTINYDLTKLQGMGLIHKSGGSTKTFYEANF